MQVEIAFGVLTAYSIALLIVGLKMLFAFANMGIENVKNKKGETHL
jgi:hypothetical protein